MIFFILEKPLTTILLGYMLHKFISYNYPEQYEKFCILCGYYVIYFFSKLQMMYLKLKPKLNEMIEPCLENELIQNMLQIFKEPKSTYDLEFILNGDVVFRCLKEDLLNESLFLPKNFDFIIYSEPSLETVNKKILYSIPKNIDEDLKIEISSYRFVLFELIINEEHIKIDFYTNQYNFYVENNKISKNFLLYFLNNYHPQIFAKYSFVIIQNFNIIYLDNSFSVKELENNAEFLFKKKDFELIETFNKVLDNNNILNNNNNNNILNNNKISDYIQFSHEEFLNEIEDEYVEMPDLIPIDENYIDNFS